jgi:hypothetical protein
MNTVRKVICDRNTGEYWCGGSEFSSKLDEAAEISSFAQARRLSRIHPSRRLVMVIFSDEKEEISLPLDDKSGT